MGRKEEWPRPSQSIQVPGDYITQFGKAKGKVSELSSKAEGPTSVPASTKQNGAENK